jgi:hypothetical protein
MTCPWGLLAWPRSGRMLPLEPRSPRECCFGFGMSTPSKRTISEANYEICLRYYAGLYASWFFHMARVIAAILRAMVSVARFGLVP